MGCGDWMYRAALESLLGFELRGNRLRLSPHLPPGWPQFELIVRRGGTSWKITVTNAASALPREINLDDDGNTHDVIF